MFYFTIEANGHDHAKETATGVESWFYLFYNFDGEFYRFARAGSWINGVDLGLLSDTLKYTATWNPFYPAPDIQGDSVFTHLPAWINRGYDFSVKGRDTRNGQQFGQFMFVNGRQDLINSYPTSKFGRWTQEGNMRFYIRIIRPGV